MRVHKIFDARSSSAVITVTLLANLVKISFFHHESPPPTITTCFSLKKNPSGVAHAETPTHQLFFRGRRTISDAPCGDNYRIGCMRHIFRFKSQRTFAEIDFGDGFVNEFGTNFVAPVDETGASFRSPIMPSGNPGKFSTSVVMVNCPPGWLPEISNGFSSAKCCIQRCRVPPPVGSITITFDDSHCPFSISCSV